MAAGDIAVPQLGAPPGIPFNPPTSLVENYVNRMPPAQVASTSIGQGIGALAQYQQYQQARQLEALKAISELYGAGGPGAVQQYAPTLNRAAGTNLIDTSQGQAQGNAPMPPSASNGGGAGVPTFAAQVPSQPAQTLNPASPMPMGQGGTGGYGGQAGGTTPPQPQGNQPSEHILNSINAGAPDFSGHLAKINQLQNQMAGFANQGKYGQTQTLQLNEQIQAEKAAMDAQQAPMQYAKNAQDLAASQQAQRLALTKPVAEEVSKQTESNQRIGLIQQQFNNLKNALSQAPSSPLGNISGQAFQATGGRIGSQSAANIMNAANPLATTLNTELSRRFNSGEVQLLSNALIPQAKDTPQYRQQKMQALQQIISAMASGNEQSIQNVGRALIGGAGAVQMSGQTPTQNQGQTGPYGATTTRNGKTYVWVASTGKYHLQQ